MTIVGVSARGSRLAPAQTETVILELKARNPGIETAIGVIITRGEADARVPAPAGLERLERTERLSDITECLPNQAFSSCFITTKISRGCLQNKRNLLCSH